MARPGRVVGVDLARAVALVGMMLVHLVPTVTVDGPTVAAMLAAGRAAPLFALLAGVSLSIVHRRDPHGAASVQGVLVRAVLLFVVGVLLGSLSGMPVLVILCFYAVLLVAALPFLGLPARTLLLLGSAWAVLAPVVVLVVERQIGPPQVSQVELADLAHPGALALELEITGTYPALVWFAYVLVGLGLGRLPLGRPAVAARIAVTGAVVLVASLVAGRLALASGVLDGIVPYRGWDGLFVSGFSVPSRDWARLLVVGEHTSTTLGVLSALGSACLVLGLCLLVGRLRVAQVVLSPLVAAGTMTLTLYVVHVLWVWADAEHGWDLPVGSPYAVWGVQVVVLCLAATLWRRLRGRGPLESVIHDAVALVTRR